MMSFIHILANGGQLTQIGRSSWRVMFEEAWSKTMLLCESNMMCHAIAWYKIREKNLLLLCFHLSFGKQVDK